MGSRSKFHKAKAATTPGRALLHGPRPKKPLVIGFEDAFWDVLRELRTMKVKGETRVFTKSVPTVYGQSDKGPRRSRRAAIRALARSFLRTANASVPRAERRRVALVEAHEALAPKKEVRA